MIERLRRMLLKAARPADVPGYVAGHLMNAMAAQRRAGLYMEEDAAIALKRLCALVGLDPSIVPTEGDKPVLFDQPAKMWADPLNNFASDPKNHDSSGLGLRF